MLFGDKTSLIYCNNISSIDILENINFKELKELKLQYNIIDDIKVLEKVKFERLKELDLKGNAIDENKISSIFEMLKLE